MAGQPWIKVDCDLASHPKMTHLAQLLEDPGAAFSAVVRLWAYCAKFVPTGVVRGPIAARILEQAVGWSGAPGGLVEAMVEARWLDATADGFAVHAWREHQGAYIDKTARDRASWRKRKVRSRVTGPGQKAGSRVTSEGRREENRREEKREEVTTKPPPPAVPESQEPAAPDAHRVAVGSWYRLWLESRGSKYPSPLPGPDAKASKRLAAMREDASEVERRMRNYLAAMRADDWLSRNGSLAHFVSRWANYADGDKAQPRQMAMTPAPHSAFAGGGYVDTRK